MKAAAWPGGITVRPSGFCRPEATLARNLLQETPAEAVRPVVAWMSVRIAWASRVAEGSPRRFSVTSRKASSTDSGSTSGV